MRWQSAVAALISTVLVAATAGYGYVVGGWFTTKVSVAEHLDSIEAYFALRVPEGSVPSYPTAILVPGCLGTQKHHSDWADLLDREGWASLTIDSFTPRGLTKLEDLEAVCEGGRPWGFERAADIIAAVAFIKTLDQLDENKIVLLGWSNGAWAAMDALSFGPDSKPTNLAEFEYDWARGIRAAGLFYPYCGFGSRSASTGWYSQPRALMFLPEKDTNVSSQACAATADGLRRTGIDIQTITYKGATHWFDNPAGFDILSHTYDQDATRNAHSRVRELLSVVKTESHGADEDFKAREAYTSLNRNNY